MASRPASSSSPARSSSLASHQPVGRSPTRRSPTRTGGATVLDLLQPGSFVKLRNQPRDLPPFELIRCRGGRCWVRQQAWGGSVQWEVAHQRLTAVA